MYVSSWIFFLLCCHQIFAENSTRKYLRTSSKSDHDITDAKSTPSGVTFPVITKERALWRTTYTSPEYSESTTETETYSSPGYGESSTENEDQTSMSGTNLVSLSTSTTELPSSTEGPCTKTPGRVKNLTSITGENFIYLSWQEPDEASCLRGYRISFEEGNQQKTYNLSLDQNTENLTNLIYCGTYQISVISVGETGDGDTDIIKITLKTPRHLDKVENLTISSVDGSKKQMNVTWHAPARHRLCVTKYRINEFDQFGNTTTTINDKNDAYILTDIIGCKEYTVNVIPMAGPNDNIDGQVAELTYNMPEIVMKPPTLNVTTIEKTSAKFTVLAENFSANMCKVTIARIKCEAPMVKNKGRDWVKNVTEDFSLEKYDLKIRDYFLNITSKLSAFTNYNCMAAIRNLKGFSNYSKIVQIMTPQEVPDKPSYIAISENEASHFVIKWKKPAIVPGIMTAYVVNIQSHGPQYFIPDGCKTDFPTDFKEKTNQNVFEYNFTEARPFFRYNIAVCGVDAAGKGDNATAIWTTKTAKPEAPRDPTVSVIRNVINPTVYDVIEKISWKLPCYSHGNPKEFKIRIYGHYRQDPLVQHNETPVIPVNSDISDVTYFFNFRMRADFIYNALVQTVLNNSMKGEVAMLQFFSPEGCPSPPSQLEIESSTNTSFAIVWKKPIQANGTILGYYANIKPLGPTYYVPPDEECQSHLQPHSEDKTNTSFRLEYLGALPNYRYQISVKANTSAGYGLDAVLKYNTTEGVPENVRKLILSIHNTQTEEYQAHMKVTFEYPCNTYGQLDHIECIYEGFRPGYSIHYENVTASSAWECDIDVKPEFTYNISVIVFNQLHSNTTQRSLETPSGVPNFQNIHELKPPKVKGTDKAVFQFSKKLFNETNGDVIYCALILAEYSDMKSTTTFGFWNSTDWPLPCENCKNGRQLTQNKWTPFSDDGYDKDSINFTIGDDLDCKRTEYCNKKLDPGTKYMLVLRIFTRTSYRDSEALIFITEKESAITAGVIVGIVICFLIATAGGYYVFIRWKTKLDPKALTLIESEEVESNFGVPPYIPKKKFITYYYNLKENYDKLKAEYSLLDAKSKELNIPITYAKFPENKRKNRYTNILTYDTTRVKLQIDEDDEISSDYINASYIRGFSGEIEYIATQGPLELTCKDFWKMVIQEKVKVIAMVSQFVEMDKQKCYKYFPSNHENMLIGEDMEVRCVSELDFEIYCVRTLQVRKDVKLYTVTHLQFLGWPDFGCPTGTDNMLLFCQQFRERVRKENGLSIVHCSAGVGRTGTMISIDILLQAVEQNKDISIFETVFELRKQRTNMVQTEKQYFYIYTCIKDYLENPQMSICEENQNGDPIYENTQVIKSTYEPNSVERHTESAL